MIESDTRFLTYFKAFFKDLLMLPGIEPGF